MECHLLLRECGGNSITAECIALNAGADVDQVTAILPALQDSCAFSKSAVRLRDVFVKPWCPPLASLSDGDVMCAWRIADYLMLPSDGLVLETAQRVLRDVDPGRWDKLVGGADHAREARALVDAVDALKPDDVARGKRVPANVDEMQTSAAWGQLESIKTARTNGCPWNESTCRCAAKNGQLEVLKWAREGASSEAAGGACPWDEYTCAYAAENGHLETLKVSHASVEENTAGDCMQWARANGCQWNSSTCGHAAERGHLETLQWARANGCPWDEYTCSNAAHNGHLQTLRWAYVNGCPWDWQGCRDCMLLEATLRTNAVQ